ncbi:MAG: hypothetical protein J6K53_08455 [Roseburia sp.]|nr:hypothetical protein [Roseburia sp.]
MGKKSIEGQLDMFELFDSVEELEERIKGVPESVEDEAGQEAPLLGHELGQEALLKEDKPEQETESAAVWQPSGRKPVMQKTFRRGELSATVAYLDYNMVYVAGWEDEPQLWQFEQSKDAVGFYVERLEAFAAENGARLSEEQEALREARMIK